MAITYSVIFEEFNHKFKIAGVANNGLDKNNIAGSVSSKGIDHSAVIIDYKCNTPLNNDFFCIYVREKNDSDKEGQTFYNMVLKEGEKYPSINDVWIYKLEKSAQDKVKAINESFSEEDLKVKEAVFVTIKINKVY